MSDSGRAGENVQGRVALRQGVLFAKLRRGARAPGDATRRPVDSETSMIVRAEHVIRQAFGPGPDDGERYPHRGLS